MDDDLYRTLASHAKTHAASKGLSDDYAMGFLNAMWYTVDAAVRDRQAQNDEIERLREVLVLADGLAVAETGGALADFFPKDWGGQEVLSRAGCWPRGAIARRQEERGEITHSLTDNRECSCGWSGEDGQRHMGSVITGKWKASPSAASEPADSTEGDGR